MNIPFYDYVNYMSKRHIIINHYLILSKLKNELLSTNSTNNISLLTESSFRFSFIRLRNIYFAFLIIFPIFFNNFFFCHISNN